MKTILPIIAFIVFLSNNIFSQTPSCLPKNVIKELNDEKLELSLMESYNSDIAKSNEKKISSRVAKRVIITSKEWKPYRDQNTGVVTERELATYLVLSEGEKCWSSFIVFRQSFDGKEYSKVTTHTRPLYYDKIDCNCK